jgi:thymidine kinase
MGRKVILIRPANSRRSHEPDPVWLATKNGERFPCFDHESAESISDYIGKADVVWIDEPNHFQDEEQLVEIIPMLRKDSIVLISGLGATSELEPFGVSMGFFLATADHVEWLYSDCDSCKTMHSATRSLYIGEAPKEGQLKVGGEESYLAVCPTCWNDLSELDPQQRRESIDL